MLELENKIKRLSGLGFLSNIEVGILCLKTIIVLLICVPIFHEGLRSNMMISFLILGFVLLVVFSVRRTKFNYNTKFKVYLILELIHLILFIGIVVYFYKIQEMTNFIEFTAIGWIILFFIIGLINFKMTTKFLFYWRLKRVFPSEGDEKYEIEVSLKKLAPYISLEKQKGYLIINYGMNGIIYGFYMYLCLLIFKNADFNTSPLLEKIQSYLVSWTFINVSNTIGLFSIFLALLTICIPVQHKIVQEAEKEMIERFKNK